MDTSLSNFRANALIIAKNQSFLEVLFNKKIDKKRDFLEMSLYKLSSGEAFGLIKRTD